jgi:hypothetical protein
LDVAACGKDVEIFHFRSQHFSDGLPIARSSETTISLGKVFGQAAAMGGATPNLGLIRGAVDDAALFATDRDWLAAQLSRKAPFPVRFLTRRLTCNE